MKNILIIAYSYTAALIGAGFASGQEILCYFTSMGKLGFLGIILSCFFFSLFAYIVLEICLLTDSCHFEDFLYQIGNRRTRALLKASIGIFAFAVSVVMLSAVGETAELLFGRGGSLAALFSAVLCSVIYMRNTDGIFKLNGIIGLFLVMGISVCCLYIIRYREYHVFSPINNAASNALTYSGYNLVSVAPVLVTLSARLKSRSDAAAVSVVSGGMLLLLMTLIFCILSVYANKIPLGEFPMLTIAMRQNKLFALIYAVMLTSAVITTLLASGGSMIETFNMKQTPYIIPVVMAAAYALSGFGFSRLINTVYRVCGIIGFVMCIYVILSCLKRKRQIQ